jgi:putative methyltransferase (TIGR04325 family)
LTTGYDAPGILEKVKLSTLEAMSNHQKSSVSWGLLSALTWIAAQNKGCLNIIDFGGALGKTCYHYKPFLDELEAVQWNVVEQSHFVELGKKEFENDVLKFHFLIDGVFFQSQDKSPIQAVLFSSVLQYLEKPYQLLSDVLKKKCKYILIARTGFTKKNKPDRITIQKVHKTYNDESYPCWVFNESKFVDFFRENGYELVYDFLDREQMNIPSEYKGCVFKLIEK